MMCFFVGPRMVGVNKSMKGPSHLGSLERRVSHRQADAETGVALGEVSVKRSSNGARNHDMLRMKLIFD